MFLNNWKKPHKTQILVFIQSFIGTQSHSFIYYLTVDSCFWAPVVELSSCDSNHMVLKAWNIYRKGLATSALGHYYLILSCTTSVGKGWDNRWRHLSGSLYLRRRGGNMYHSCLENLILVLLWSNVLCRWLWQMKPGLGTQVLFCSDVLSLTSSWYLTFWKTLF